MVGHSLSLFYLGSYLCLSGALTDIVFRVESYPHLSDKSCLIMFFFFCLFSKTLSIS